jgi:hypothetical protein
MSDEEDTLAGALRAAGHPDLAGQLEDREEAAGGPTTLADVLRNGGYDDLAAQLDVLLRAQTQEVTGGTLEPSLSDQAAAAFYRAGITKPRA